MVTFYEYEACSVLQRRADYNPELSISKAHDFSVVVRWSEYRTEPDIAMRIDRCATRVACRWCGAQREVRHE